MAANTAQLPQAAPQQLTTGNKVLVAQAAPAGGAGATGNDPQYRGPCNNAGTIQAAGSTKAVVADLITKNLDVAPFTAAAVTGHAVGIEGYLAMGVFSSMRFTRTQDRMVNTLAETMAPYMPDSRFLPRADAREMLVNTVRQGLPAIATTMGALPAEVLALQDGNNTALTDAQGVVSQGITPGGCMSILLALARTMAPQDANRIKSYIGVIMVSLPKQGNASDAFVDKIIQGAGTYMPGLQATLTTANIQTVWNSFSFLIDEHNAETIMTEWTGMLDADGIRLSVTLQQAKGSGLTALDTICKAMCRFSDFPWWVVQQNFTGEMDKVSAAIQAVGTNRYYGFKKDLGPAKSTNFKTIAYIAKELLVKTNMDPSLSRYAGFTRTPVHKTFCDQLVSDYVANYDNSIDKTAPTQAVTDSTQEVYQWAHAYAAVHIDT